MAVSAQLTLTWAAGSADEEGFSIERALGTATFGEVVETGAGVTSYIDSGLADATTYCYRVRAFAAAGSSDYSNTACAATAQMFGLAVLKMGAGSGTVTSSPAGITCGGSCSGTYPAGTYRPDHERGRRYRCSPGGAAAAVPAPAPAP